MGERSVAVLLVGDWAMFVRIAIQISQTCAHERLVLFQQFWWILRFVFGIFLHQVKC